MAFDQDFAYNPLLNFGMGLLAASGPSPQPVSLGQAALGGLQQMQGALGAKQNRDFQQARINEMNETLAAARQQRERQRHLQDIGQSQAMQYSIGQGDVGAIGQALMGGGFFQEGLPLMMQHQQAQQASELADRKYALDMARDAAKQGFINERSAAKTSADYKKMQAQEASRTARMRELQGLIAQRDKGQVKAGMGIGTMPWNVGLMAEFARKHEAGEPLSPQEEVMRDLAARDLESQRLVNEQGAVSYQRIDLPDAVKQRAGLMDMPQEQTGIAPESSDRGLGEIRLPDGKAVVMDLTARKMAVESKTKTEEAIRGLLGVIKEAKEQGVNVGGPTGYLGGSYGHLAREADRLTGGIFPMPLTDPTELQAKTLHWLKLVETSIAPLLVKESNPSNVEREKIANLVGSPNWWFQHKDMKGLETKIEDLIEALDSEYYRQFE